MDSEKKSGATQINYDKLNIGLTVKLSLAYIWISLFNNVFDTALPKILTDPVSLGGLGMNHTWKGLVMAADNIIGLFILPLFGFLSDRTRTRFGKRTPYIVIGGILAALSWTAAGFALLAQKRVLFLITLGLGLTFISMSRPASLAVLPDFTLLKNRRKANAITQILSVVATLGGIVLVALMTSYSGYPWIFEATAGLMLVLIALYIILVKEKTYEKTFPKEKQTEDNQFLDYNTAKEHLVRNKAALFAAVFFFYVSFNGLVSSLSVYSAEVLHLSAGSFTIPQLLTLVSACVIAVPVSKLQTLIKRKFLLILGYAIMILSFLMASFQRSINVFMIAGFVFAGLGYSVSIVNLYPYVLELSNQSNIGKNTGFFNLVMMCAMVITPILSGYFIDKWGIVILFPYCLISLALGVVSLFLIYDKSPIYLKKNRNQAAQTPPDGAPEEKN